MIGECLDDASRLLCLDNSLSACRRRAAQSRA